MCFTIPRICKTTLQMLGGIRLEAVKGRLFFFQAHDVARDNPNMTK